MTKTLGEVAMAARDALEHKFTTQEQRWEIVASAVAEEVRNRCVAACAEQRIGGTLLYTAHDTAVDMCIAAIKDMT